MTTLPILATITSQLTTAVAHHGMLATFVLMALDALLPVGGELVMLYAGVLAAGAVAGRVSLLGTALPHGLQSYLALALAGSLGYLAGALVGWQIGVRGGRPLVDRHGRWLHLTPARFRRAEAWFERRGGLAVLLGRITPLVRSFISIPAGVLGTPLAPYTILTLIGSMIWCFGFAAVGWAVGGSWEHVDHAFRDVEIAVVVAAVVLAAVVIARLRRRPRVNG